MEGSYDEPSQEPRVERQQPDYFGGLVERRDLLTLNPQPFTLDTADIDALYTEMQEPIEFHFAMDRRSFVQILGAGVLITVVGSSALAQQPGRGGAAVAAAAADLAAGRRPELSRPHSLG